MFIDFNIWIKKYEEEYHFPIEYYSGNGVKTLEQSPTFDSISKAIQKRGYLKREEFINICMWKRGLVLNFELFSS